MSFRVRDKWIYFSFVIWLFVLLLLSGCKNSVVDPYAGTGLTQAPVPPLNTGSFHIKTIPDSLYSCQSGGGLVILFWESTSNFSAESVLSTLADPALNCKLSDDKLNMVKRISELTIHPNPDTKTGIYYISLLVGLNGTLENILIPVHVLSSLYGQKHDSIFVEFIRWIQKAYPALNMNEKDNWFGYNKKPGWVGIGYSQFINDKWDMTIKVTVVRNPVYYMLLRARGELYPLLAAKKDTSGIIQSIQVSEFEE